MIIPDDLLIEVDVYQYHVPGIITLPVFPLAEAANYATQWLKGELLKEKTHLVISGPQEIQVLRLLRHVREEVDGIKLKPHNLVFWFDMPDDSRMIKIEATQDGDLNKKVPGGFFSNRFAELP